MKPFIIFLMLFSVSLFAEDKAPKPFQNSSIERKLEDGKVQKFDGDKYMIVKRGAKKKPAVITRTVTIEVEKPVYRKNALKLFLGHGPNELQKNGNSIELDKDPFIGLGYQRMLNQKFSIEIIGTTNESIMIGGGFHF